MPPPLRQAGRYSRNGDVEACLDTILLHQTLFIASLSDLEVVSLFSYKISSLNSLSEPPTHTPVRPRMASINGQRRVGSSFTYEGASSGSRSHHGTECVSV